MAASTAQAFLLAAMVAVSAMTDGARAQDVSGLPGWTLSLPNATTGAPAPEQPKCPCLSSWTYYFDPPNPYLGPSVLVTGCANPNADPKGDWCEVDASCASTNVKQLRTPDGNSYLWDYCAEAPPGTSPEASPSAPQPSPSPTNPYEQGFSPQSPSSVAAPEAGTSYSAAPVAPAATAPAEVAPSPSPANGTGNGTAVSAPVPAAPSSGSSAVAIAVGVAVPVAVLAALGLFALCYRRRIARWWYRVKPGRDPGLLPVKTPGSGGGGGAAGRRASGGGNGGPAGAAGGLGAAAALVRGPLAPEAGGVDPLLMEHHHYSIDMNRPDAGPVNLKRGSKEVRRSIQQAPWGQTSGSDTKLTDTKRSSSVESPDTPSLQGSAAGSRASAMGQGSAAGRRSTGTYRTTTGDSLGSVGMSTMGGTYDYGTGEGISGISGGTYGSSGGEEEPSMGGGGADYEESREAHFVRVFIQIVTVGPQRRESIRLWLVPVSDLDETEAQTTTRPRMRRGVSVILPSDPVNVDADLDLDYDRDLAFPLYSYIGAGAFGQVHRAILKGRLPVAVKLMTGENAPPGVAESLIEEIQIMSRINHPNVVKCYGGSQVLPNVFIVEELMDCSLADLLHPKHVRGPVLLPLKRVLEIAADVANALWYLHPSIVHRDLKPGNVLLGPSGIAKVGDFGISRIKLASYLATQHLEAGTVSYMAPECFTKEWGVGEKSDVYSLGIMLWEMVTGLRPWADFGFQMAIVYQVVQCDNRPEFPKNSECPESLRRLIKSCWRRNPRERPSAGDVLQRLSMLLKQLEQQGRL